MVKIKRFIECLIPVTACNLKCSYCYVIQRDNRTLKIPDLDYPIEQIGRALSKDRFGGTCYFSICGAGETLMPKYIVDLVKEILKQGHLVNITTNGTLNDRFDELVKIDSDLLKRLNLSFSFHYLELKRTNKLDDFFNNINKIRKAGISFVLQLNLCDEYIPHIEEIKKICLEKVGAYPQIAATRKEINLKDNIELLTELSDDEYIKKGKEFKSPLFDFTIKNFNVKRKEFCYAGDWSFVLNLKTGLLSKCYGTGLSSNIFENPDKKIKFEAIGKNCKSRFCLNSSHFMSLGVIPTIETPTYGELRNRSEANWYQSEEIKSGLNSKLNESNAEYSKIKKIYVTTKYKIIFTAKNILRPIKNVGNIKKMHK